MNEDKNYIIDPLTTLCKLALIYFMPDKTKLGIGYHTLNIQEHTYYQWFERMRNRDNRLDISNLNVPLIKAIKWYVLDNPERINTDATTLDSIRTICSFAIKSLEKLQNHTYQADITTKIILQYFINILTDALNEKWDERHVVKIESDNVLSEKIKYNFEANIINSIAKMINDASKLNNVSEDMYALIDCAHKLLINRDSSFVKLMKTVNTTL